MQLNKRVASLIIHGVPQHAWCEEAFSVIASTWGRVLIPETCETDNLNLAFGRVGILTDFPGLISTSIIITVDDIKYSINIMEDLFESNRLNPMLACNDIGSEYEHGDWHDWRSENLESDDFSDEYDLPETPKEKSPAKLSSPQSSEYGRSVSGERSAHHPRRNMRGRENSGSRHCGGNSREASAHVSGGSIHVPQADNYNGSDPIVSQESGPTPNKSQAVGRNSRKKSNSFDLNAQPTHSLDSRLSMVRPN
ncbi:hypothetical protein L2E82_14646 [Cichorium intybus]|uniref:Uncharacterized protein n=1 Tax=Cichorium intybus TaxID=13427 RepID=A0ACB9F106_CICIN|nr:hypothetical protein L2E82_14646 [Cichorium intybus]